MRTGETRNKGSQTRGWHLRQDILYKKKKKPQKLYLICTIKLFLINPEIMGDMHLWSDTSAYHSHPHTDKKPRNHSCKLLQSWACFFFFFFFFFLASKRRWLFLKADSCCLLILTKGRVCSSSLSWDWRPHKSLRCFSSGKPDKPQLAERLLTKNQGNAAPLHHLLPVTLHLNLPPLSPGGRAPNCGAACMPTFAQISHKHFSLDKSSNWPHDWAVYICSLSSLYLVVFTACLPQRITQGISLLSSAWSETSCNTSLSIWFSHFASQAAVVAAWHPYGHFFHSLLLYRICSKKSAALASNRNILGQRHEKENLYIFHFKEI